jgi:invasion protein IalB
LTVCACHGIRADNQGFRDSVDGGSVMMQRSKKISAASRLFCALTALGVAVLVAGTAAAQKPAPKKETPAPAAKSDALPAPKELGSYEAWTSVELTQSGGKICYMFARPASSEPKSLKRSDVMLTITHRPALKRRDEVSFQAGYAYKKGETVAVDVDGKKFQFFTRPDVDPDAAWAQDPAADKAIVTALKNGKTLKVQGASEKGAKTTDVFSLGGFSKAYADIGKACGMP